MTIDLFYWPSALKWGLPSFDMNSLHVLAFAKFSGADVALHPSFQSYFAKETKTLPSLSTVEGDLCDKPESIIKYLKDNGFNSDTSLNVVTANNILPFTALIEERLRPAITSLIWLDAVNYKEVSHSMYAKACRYPFNFSTPHRLQKSEEEILKEYKSLMEVEPKVLERIESDAKSALNLLSEYLGENDYLLGKDPSSVDALLFSVLAVLSKLPLVSCKLQNHLRGCTNLCQYVARILQKYFQQELSQPKDSESKPEEAHSSNDSSDGSDWKYDWLFPITVASIAMVSYATNAGLLYGKK